MDAVIMLCVFSFTSNKIILHLLTATIHTGKAHGLPDTSEKLANMTIGPGKQPARRTMPPMRAGGLNGQSGLFLGRSQEIQSGRTCPRKVAG